MAQANSNAPSNFTSGTTPSFIPYPVAAAAHIYQGRPVFVDASGYANGDVSSGRRFVGFAQLEADNSVGAATAGAIVVNVTPAQAPDGQYYDLAAVGATQAWVGQVTYWTDNTTVALSGNVICGVVVQFFTGLLVQVNTSLRA